MTRITYIADTLFDGQTLHRQCPLTVEDGRVVALGTGGAREIRLSGMLAPGFIDIQVNGGGGVLFNAEPSVESIARIGAAHARFGTTGFLPTLITDDAAIMGRAADAVAAALAALVLGVLGVHFEGPHLSVAKKGVHDPRFIRPLDDAEWAVLLRQDLGIRVVTLAPETVAPADIQRLVQAGVRVCLGHSNADYETVMAALDAGATGFTHLFNAMSPLESRAPGMVGAALLDERSWCGLIVDGFHMHAASARLALRAKARGKLLLVTDAMSPVGTDATEFELFGVPVMRTGERLHTANGTLAGSTLDMAGAVRNSVRELGVELEEALRMASRYPADFLGRSANLGRLTEGASADMVLLDDSQQVRATWIGGDTVYRAN